LKQVRVDLPLLCDFQGDRLWIATGLLNYKYGKAPQTKILLVYV